MYWREVVLVVDARGFEPLTSSVSGKRSKPTELSVRKTNALLLQSDDNIRKIRNQINDYFIRTIFLDWVNILSPPELIFNR